MEAIKKTKTLLGSSNFIRKKNEIKNIKFRRSLYVAQTINKGEKFTEHNLKSLRPKIGLDPIHIFQLLGKKSKRKLPYGLPITKTLLKKIS